MSPVGGGEKMLMESFRLILVVYYAKYESNLASFLIWEEENFDFES